MKPTTITIPTSHFALIAIQGENALTFLQGQLTSDIHQITENKGSFAACCDHTGRMVSNFFIFQQNKIYYLLLPKSITNLTLTHLKKYALFSKVALSALDDIKAAAYPGSEINLEETDENTWRLSNIEMGFLWIYPQTSRVFIPQMINLDKWDGISFTKGCYIGQEIIARTQYLGKLKRHLYRAILISSHNPRPGDELKNTNGEVIGIVAEVGKEKNEEYKLLAVIQDHSLSENLIFNEGILQNIELVSA